MEMIPPLPMRSRTINGMRYDVRVPPPPGTMIANATSAEVVIPANRIMVFLLLHSPYRYARRTVAGTAISADQNSNLLALPASSPRSRRIVGVKVMNPQFTRPHAPPYIPTVIL